MNTTSNLNNFRNFLRAMRARIDAQALKLEIADSPPANELVDLSDRASQQAEVDVNIGLAEKESALRTEIDDALQRIEAGTFGICEECAAVIARARLSAVPYARYCIRCERRLEQNQ